MNTNNDGQMTDALLDDLVDLEQGRKRDIYATPSPDNCDLCDTSLSERKYMIDGSANDWDSWACMCATCFLAHGKGIGFGSGQLYIRDAEGWLQVGGFDPVEN